MADDPIKLADKLFGPEPKDWHLPKGWHTKFISADVETISRGTAAGRRVLDDAALAEDPSDALAQGLRDSLS